MKYQSNIGILIVMYNPNLDTITRIEQLASCSNGVIVDNSIIRNFDTDIVGKMLYIPLCKNTGIAHAQSIGIQELKKYGFEYVVFFDQDSEVVADYIVGIVDEYKRISQLHPNLFLLGPRVYDKTNGEEYHSVIHKEAKADKEFIIKREIISSGSCASLRMIDKVGMLLDEMFIDFVDFEWCWRAKAKGFICGITENVALPHKVGNRELKLLHGYKVIISAPFRYYYQYRNHLWLMRKAYVPRQWILNTGIKHLIRLFYFPFCIKGWKDLEKYMLKGICDGITRKNNYETE